MAARHLLLLLPAAAHALVQGPWSDTTMDPGARAKALVANMTMDEKLEIFNDAGCSKAFSNTQIPPLVYNNGMMVKHGEDGMRSVKLTMVQLPTRSCVFRRRHPRYQVFSGRLR